MDPYTVFGGLLVFGVGFLFGLSRVAVFVERPSVCPRSVDEISDYSGGVRVGAVYVHNTQPWTLVTVNNILTDEFGVIMIVYGGIYAVSEKHFLQTFTRR